MFALFPSRQIAFTLGPLAVHWYGVMYALAFIVGMWLLPRMLRLVRLQLSDGDQEKMVFSTFLGVLLGGRLGFVLFYGGTYYLEHPMKIFAVWEGGMSSHGGFIGVALALLVFCHRKNVNFLRLIDALVVPAALGLAFGRLGNLINGELYGTMTTLPWGMSFPGAEGLRHPTQIYAIFKDLFIASMCYLHLVRSPHAPAGRTTGIFLCLYALLRFIVEIFRDQPYGYTLILGFGISRGQLLTIPVFLIGVVVLIVTRRTSLSRAS